VEATLKRFCIIVNALLLAWFFLDMFGFALGGFVLVESAWNSIDGIWLLLFVGLFSFFGIKERQGKYPLTVFLFIWAAIQFSSHWLYTLFGATSEKVAGYNQFFANTWHIIPASPTVVVPDFYHLVLHLLIVSALICMTVYCIRNRKRKKPILPL
jgi:hypothetical protein